MSMLFDSYRSLYSQLRPGAPLNYLSGGGQVLFESYNAESGDTTVVRDGSPLTIPPDKINLLLEKLADGSPVHVDTFLAAGGNARTVIETLIAHLPEVGWRKIENRKHLQAFEYEIHLPGVTLGLDGDEWLSAEWALSVLFYEWDQSTEPAGLSKEALATKLEQTTRKNAASWKMRVSNLQTVKTGGPLDGGEKTKARSVVWLERYRSTPEVVKQLAVRAFKESANRADVAVVCQELGLAIPEVKEELPPSELLLALTAKPFAIITGTSGTGKTREAENLAALFATAERLSDSKNIAIVAVGSDWTDNRSVVGFVNHMRYLEFRGSRRPSFQPTPVVDLLLYATENPEVPCFLILDEMNLSHVERYFSDFLSAMESREGHIQLHNDGNDADASYRLARSEGDELGVPRRIPYPQNLFVIGTVNVDETTYMFSPKVLDRAHVLEFGMSEANLRDFLAEPKRPENPRPVTAEQGSRFLAWSRSCRRLEQRLPDSVAEKLNGHLIDMFILLSHGRFEFGYRSTTEVLSYMVACRHAALSKEDWDRSAWKADFDRAVIQKLLPRIHGSRARIGGIVAALAEYCTNLNLETAMRYLPTKGKNVGAMSLSDLLNSNESGGELPRSAAKLRKMGSALSQEQFASFIC